MSDSSQFHKGIVIQSKDDKLILCIHPETALRFISKLITNKDGWARFAITKKIFPKGSITHGIHQIDLNMEDVYRQTKTDAPEEFKSVS